MKAGQISSGTGKLYSHQHPVFYARTHKNFIHCYCLTNDMTEMLSKHCKPLFDVTRLIGRIN